MEQKTTKKTYQKLTDDHKEIKRLCEKYRKDYYKGTVFVRNIPDFEFVAWKTKKSDKAVKNQYYKIRKTMIYFESLKKEKLNKSKFK